MTLDAVRALLDPLKMRVRLMIARAIVDLVNDTGGRQTVQFHMYGAGAAALDQHPDTRERFQNYGFTSNPHPGAEAIVLFPGGGRDVGIAIAVEDRRYRLKGMQGGEVALYDDLGQVVYLRREGVQLLSPNNVTISAGGTLHLEGETVEIFASKTRRDDCAGYATQFQYLGGNNWGWTYWTNGAVLAAPVTNEVAPPGEFTAANPAGQF